MQSQIKSALHILVGQSKKDKALLTSKTRSIDILHSMIWHKEPFLPPHKHSAVPLIILDRAPRFLHIALDLLERREPAPVRHVVFIGGAPILREEPVSVPDYLRVKVGRQFGPVIG